MDTRVEEWRPVLGWEGLYEVSSLGRVKTLPREVPYFRGGTATRKEKVMACAIDKEGYAVVLLQHKGKRKLCKVHRLMAESFILDKPEGKDWVLHKDGYVDNLTIDNLYWGDQQDNEQDKLRHKRHPQAIKTHCMRGHEFSDSNTHINKKTGARRCRSCLRIHDSRRKKKPAPEESKEG